MDQRRDAADVGGTGDTSNMCSDVAEITAPTPEQMRELANDKHAWLADDDRARVALLAAADEQERLRYRLNLAESRRAPENAGHAATCSRIQAIALEISGVDCDCWKAR